MGLSVFGIGNLSHDDMGGNKDEEGTIRIAIVWQKPTFSYGCADA